MHRAHRSLWTLTALTILAAGLVSQALTARAGPVSDGLLALSVVLLLITGTLLIRVLRYLSRAAAAAALRNAVPRADRADDRGTQ
jgi:hypothetical protein